MPIVPVGEPDTAADLPDMATELGDCRELRIARSLDLAFSQAMPGSGAESWLRRRTRLSTARSGIGLGKRRKLVETLTSSSLPGAATGQYKIRTTDAIASNSTSLAEGYLVGGEGCAVEGETVVGSIAKHWRRPCFGRTLLGFLKFVDVNRGRPVSTLQKWGSAGSTNTVRKGQSVGGKKAPEASLPLIPRINFLALPLGETRIL